MMVRKMVVDKKQEMINVQPNFTVENKQGTTTPHRQHKTMNSDAARGREGGFNNFININLVNIFKLILYHYTTPADRRRLSRLDDEGTETP